jgi:hypothetical protein
MLKQEEADHVKGPLDGKGPSPLPILFIEDGMEILKFSEIFSIHEPLKKGQKRDNRYSIFKGMLSCFWYFLSGVMFSSHNHLTCSGNVTVNITCAPPVQFALYTLLFISF